MIRRNTYINTLLRFADKPQIKVLTGLRRSGKSTILALFSSALQERGVKSENIININLESFQFDNLKNYQQLYTYVQQRVAPLGKTYILLDEIQEVEEWEKAVNAFMVDFDADIYITGSNSKLLSSELATYIAGRYVEIPIFTLSFGEYLLFNKEEKATLEKSFLKFLHLGGFPVVHAFDYTEADAYKIVQDIYSSIVLRDTVQRFGIRDVELLERVVRYAFDNIGNTFSGKNVADYFKSQQRKIDLNTVYNYLSALESSFILYRVPRFDIKGKELLKTQEKFYLGDTSLLFANVGFKNRMISGILENMVFLELKRQGYAVFVGKLGDQEVDFVAERSGDRTYIQVTYKIENEQTIVREFGNLSAIPDQHPKFVVSMDDLWTESVDGVRHMHIRDFLAKGFVH